MALMIEMTHLRALHMSMRKLGIDVQQFRVPSGAAGFDCLFSVRERPFVLSLTSRGENPKFFRFDVQHGYRIEAKFSEQDYYALAKLLRTHGRSRGKLIPSEFLSRLDKEIPTDARGEAVPTEQEIVRLRRDLEETDKPYFDHWGSRGSGPSDRNKAKTLAVLGPEALKFSISVNKSGIWSPVPLVRDWRSG
ncbi:DUF6037 family protein [Sphingomonas sp. NIBR02145]|uniref:DUF6037 family protein n=1 Tax=Sphingomonas sp. NIBR02145 TaxID=3014784 RepID=UPI0022B38DA4|nr:DUF6037 family protein [Sphingomonas sp. NIBR02145]WHU04264.1 DUF6037 family protein [Sphingomonas sp. NIBR02145]